MGETVRSILKPGSCGRTLGVFSNALYLKCSDNEPVWLITKCTPMHRRGIQILVPIPRISPDSMFRVRDQCLTLDSEINFDLSQSTRWDPPYLLPEEVFSFKALFSHLLSYSSLFDDLNTPTGFGVLIPKITKFKQGYPLPTSFPDHIPALEYALPTLARVFQACIVHDFTEFLRSSENLIGLGDGLTPSGDDFIGGMLFSIVTLQNTYSQFQGFSRYDLELFLDSSSRRTNLISYTLLKEHAAGHASETIHRFIIALLTGKPQEFTRRLVSYIVRVGHSTGWDTLAGLWAGMLLILDDDASPMFKKNSSTFRQP